MATNQRELIKFNLAASRPVIAHAFESSSDSPLLVANFEEKERDWKEFVKVWTKETICL